MNTKDYIFFVIYPFIALLQVYNCELFFDAIYALPRHTYDCIAANKPLHDARVVRFLARGRELGNFQA